MIDLHAHVLPGIDDGPGTWEESLLMCRQAVEDGITTLVATPHITPGVYANNRASIEAAVEELRGQLEAAGVPLVIVPSAEVWLDPNLLLEGDAVIPYLGDGGGRRFVLIHVPPRVVLDSVCDLVHTLASRGVTPIVSHPERHREFQNEPEQLRALVAAGALSQVTAASLVGRFGRSSAVAARRLLALGLVHVISSDAHSHDHRPPMLSDGVAAAAEVVGAEQARFLVSDGPASILAGRMPSVPAPEIRTAPSRRTFLDRMFKGSGEA